MQREIERIQPRARGKRLWRYQERIRERQRKGEKKNGHEKDVCRKSSR